MPVHIEEKNLHKKDENGTNHADKSFLFITAHDFRTPRKASLHLFAEKLIPLGKVRFFSMRYSWLSKNRPDGRHIIADKANFEENYNGVSCFLWKTILHPFNLKKDILHPIEKLFYKMYVFFSPSILKEWIKKSDVIFYESGIAPIFFDMAKTINPHARMVYIASDELSAINVARYVKDTFYRVSGLMDYNIIKSKEMRADFSPSATRYFVPHGIDPTIVQHADPSPYEEGLHAISVGSMLFDAAFFDIAGEIFPDITFHVIGSGQVKPRTSPANVIYYDEMKYEKTIAYVKHATIGIAPYLDSNIPESLADTSMKLMQYAFFNIPAVCPHKVVGNHAYRFGYKVDDKESIILAIQNALESEPTTKNNCLNWQDVTQRILDPLDYDDVRV